MRWLKTTLKHLNTWQVEALLGLLVGLILLRIPNLTEPYWYGDEAIYLTIGNALRHGSRLYLDIVDHKTPLIYYLAMTPTQLWFRLLFLVWMVLTTVAFYCISLKFFKHLLATVIATAFFIVATTLPALEGNIPNGELFVMGFILVGGAFLTRLPILDRWLQGHDRPMTKLSDNVWLFITGVFFGLGILTKVPALFDWAAWLSIGWFGVCQRIMNEPRRHWASHLGEASRYLGLLGIGAISAIILSIVYFVARGAGQAYLDFGLLYNFRYAGSWSPSFAHPLIAVAFTLPVKVMILAVTGVTLTLLTRKLKVQAAFISFWLVASLVAATLSNRPYPHYFLQVVPPLALAVGWVVVTIDTARHRFQLKHVIGQVALVGLPILLVIGTWINLGFYTYPTLSYYSNFWQLMIGHQSYDQYAQRFNGSVHDNQLVTDILTHETNRNLFIWGTNPLLYAQSKTIPTSRFTVAFHIKDFDDYQRTLTQIQATQPNYIVVMNDDAQTFPELNRYLDAHYMPNTSFETLVLWKRWE